MLIFFLLAGLQVWSAELKVLSLNLHGLHPMGEERRIKVKATGEKELSWSHLHYFTNQEIQRGLERRQKQLAVDIQKIAPDIIFLQEVGGGVIDQKKNCQEFLKTNTAKDLGLKLSSYKSFEGCRGNLGWWTDNHTFSDFSIETENSKKTIYKAGDNPYPESLIIEGLGFLVSSKIKVLDQRNENIVINKNGESFFFQILKFTVKDQAKKWWLAVNIHGGHKIQHFEQAVATRHYITDYVKNNDESNFSGLLIAGDFNSLSSAEEVSTTPWSFYHRWQTREILSQELMTLNGSDYKPFATLPTSEAKNRTQKTVEELFRWFAIKRSAEDGSLNEVTSAPCSLDFKEFNPMCSWHHKIDHIYHSPGIKIKNYSGLYQQNNWTDLTSTLSDHPGILATLKI